MADVYEDDKEDDDGACERTRSESIVEFVPETSELDPFEKLSSLESKSQYNSESSNAMLRCIILAGFSPQIIRVCKVPVARKNVIGKGGRDKNKESTVVEMRQADGTEILIDRTSITHRDVGRLFSSDQDKYARFCGKREAFLTYYKKQSTGGKIYLHDCTMVPPIGVLLFSATGGFTGDLLISKSRKKVEIGGWIRFHIQELHVVLLKQLHAAVECLLKDRVEDPSMDVSGRKELLVKVVETLLDQD